MPEQSSSCAACSADAPALTACVVVCRFYETDSTIKIGMMEAFKKLAVDPESLPDIIIASIGRTTWKVGQAATTAALHCGYKGPCCPSSVANSRLLSLVAERVVSRVALNAAVGSR